MRMPLGVLDPLKRTVHAIIFADGAGKGGKNPAEALVILSPCGVGASSESGTDIARSSARAEGLSACGEDVLRNQDVVLPAHSCDSNGIGQC